MAAPLQYKISSWDDLSRCKSNNSTKLRISVTHFLNEDLLKGIRIAVVHDHLGDLFATILNGSGNLISKFDEGLDPDMSVQDILKQLARFGFLIEYKRSSNIGGEQLDKLIALGSLGFDKIRILPVVHKDERNQLRSYYHVVVFKGDKDVTKNWTLNTYVCPRDHFEKVLVDGAALNITKLPSEGWEWLEDYVMNIADILNDNARCC